MPGFNIVAMLFGSVVFQVVGITFMGLSQGYTIARWSIASAMFFCLGIWLMGRVSGSGVGVSVVIPIVSAAIPLISIVVGLTLFHEPASPLKIVLLVAAASLAGYASSLA